MKKISLLFALFLGINGFAQVKLQGVVKDSIGNPLELANVIAINKESNALESYAITNNKGYYKLQLGKNGTYNIKVSYIGLKTTSEDISTKEADITKDFTLLPDNALDAVELTYEMPVTIKGDTIVYNADSFKNGSERKLEDVLEKLPGVEITEDGGIEVEGNRVQKITVNGKDFFDGDTKLATENIPSNAVDKIEVLRNFSEVNQLRSVQNNQNNVAINIKLKEGKENFWFGDITAGVGDAPSPHDELYIVQPKLFYYSPKYSINVIGDLNNIGEAAINNRDLRSFGGGFRAPSRDSGTSLNLGNNGLSGLTNLGNAQKIESKLVATNFSYSPKETLDLSGFVILNSTRIDTRTERFIRYTDDDLGIPDEDVTSIGREASDQALAKLSLLYKPNPNNQLDYDVLTRISKDTERQTELSSVIGGTRQLDEVTPFSINQNLNYYYTLDEDNIFAFEAQHLIRDEDPFYNAVLNNDPTNNGETDPDDRDAYDDTAAALGLNQLLNTYDLGQDRRVKSNQLDAKLDYYHIINPKSNISFTLGTIFSRQDFNSNIFQFLDDGSIFDPVPNITDDDGNLLRAENDTQYNFSDVYVGTRYNVRTGKFTFRPGLSLHYYGNNNTQFGQDFGENFFRVLPEFEARVQFKKSESLQLNYRMSNQFTDVTTLANGLVLNSFNALAFGEPDLQNGLSHSVSLFYRSFNLFNNTNVFGGVTYNKNIDQIRSDAIFNSVITTRTFFNSQFADETLTAFGSWQKRFGKLITTMRANFNYSLRNQFIQGRRSANESFTQSYRPEIRTNFREAPNVRFRYNYSISNNEQGTTTTKIITNSPSIRFDAYIWKSVTFVTDYTYTNQDFEGSSESFQTWSARLGYRKDRDAKWEYEIRANNILNIDANVNNNVTDFSVVNSATFLQPRFITFRVVYSL
ncbi:TonB-dependent receptor [Psychroserpens sp.]|uniref:TonB-dependent receptor n=1 Tax=Psychroserpens sp. TaxID=2020870 RepID=UPI001B1071E4|nr:TonB-dependent receptor [Psychroserpens sp.]MBO6607921.1 TonB-dependent receptor [Psychroserpens sp.]MBO6654952.1 TonB-dependent receptor [Psychroserpens sp.]MBO6682974.1 TonB-dependent receptor [Psychroserpens sp.]MBO6751279.1 TonB-dependent receptor [Psychroserpens sp.]MBO6916462.1 TonB-dependent receptor [Psychroserpens sp.]